MSRKSSCAAAVGAVLAASLATSAMASSHREAPQVTELPKNDNTDVYAFRSYEPGREGFVTLLTNFQPFQEPGGGPNYFTMDPDAIYEIHVDNTGDAIEDITFQFKFDNTLKNDIGKTVTVGGKTLPIALRHIGQVTEPLDPDLGEDETYSVAMIRGNRRSGNRGPIRNASGGATSFVKPFDNVGNKTIPDYPAYAKQFIYDVTIPDCATAGARVFAGQREENFAVNLGPIFDLVNFVPIEGSIAQSDANQELINHYNITTLAIEVPIACLTGTGNGVIGVWSTSSLRQAKLLRPNPTYEAPARYGGAYVQVSRLGMPLVNELVIGLPQKDLFNAAKPTQDGALADYVTNPTFPAILNALFGSAAIAPTNFPRNDLVTTFLTGFQGVNQLKAVTPSEMLRLNTAVTPTPQAQQQPLGLVANDLAGFPNGRRPGDDVVDIVLRVAMGRLCYPVPVGGVQTDLGLCTPAQAPSGQTPYTDGAPSNASYTMNEFPYLNPALRGSPRPQTTP